MYKPNFLLTFAHNLLKGINMEEELFASLDLSNILEPDELAALEQENKPSQENKEPEEEEKEEEKEPIIAENLGVDDLFGSESVGNKKEETKENKRDASQKVEASSPDNTFSSIASAFKVDGVSLFTEADDERLKGIKSSEDFEDFLEERLNDTIKSKLDETQNRIKEALEYGLDPDDVRIFENSINNLSKITNEDIDKESEEGEKLRRQLILSDFINKGFSEDRAKKKTQQSFDNGTDKEDAKDALESNKEFYQSKYDAAIAESKAQYEADKAKAKQMAQELKSNILNDKNAFGEIEVDSTTRQKVYDFVSRPVGKDEDGRPITALQKYISENRNDFMKFVGYYYILTNGFKTLENVEKKVEKKVGKRQASALEAALNSTQRGTNGEFKLVSGVDKESYAGSGWMLDNSQ